MLQSLKAGPKILWFPIFFWDPSPFLKDFAWFEWKQIFYLESPIMFDLYLHGDGRFKLRDISSETKNGVALQGAPMDVWDMDNSSAVPDACRENIEGKGWGERDDGTGDNSSPKASSCCKF